MRITGFTEKARSSTTTSPMSSVRFQSPQACNAGNLVRLKMSAEYHIRYEESTVPIPSRYPSTMNSAFDPVIDVRSGDIVLGVNRVYNENAMHIG